ncbi:MAG: hypothetical protein OEV91_08575 [Desulfobulbaceae bacterium]|nr:hypothetical protein [Desulfobulbaceae bacterium]
METICCKCHRAKGERGWIKVRILPQVKMSHGYCPECYRQAMEKLQEMKARFRPVAIG